MRRLLLVIALFFLSLPADAEENDALFQSSRGALEKLKENVKRVTLANGMKILLYRRGVAPVFSGVVAVGVGGVDESAGETGISHMFEHMAFKGTPNIGTKNFDREKVLLAKLEEIIGNGRPLSSFSEEERRVWIETNRELNTLWNNEQFTQEFQLRGAEGLNASTNTEVTNYFVSLPRTSFEFWCWIESERLLRPVLRQFYQERDVVMEERRMRFENDPTGKLYEALLQNAFSIHPFRNPVIGYKNDIERLTASKLESFRKRYYVPSNIVVSVIGDVDANTDIEILSRYFGRLPAGTRPEKPRIIEPEQNQERMFIERATAASTMMIAYHKPNYPSPEDAKMTVLSEVLNGSSQSPLFVDLVKKGRVAASVEHEEGPGIQYPNLLTFTIASKTPYSNKVVLRKFDESLNRVLTDGFPDELLSMAKRSIAVDYLANMKSNINLGKALAQTELQFGDWSTMIDWYEQAMKVSKDDVLEVGRKFLQDRNRTIGFLERETP